MIESVNICGVNVSAINIPKACEAIGQWIKNKTKIYICVAPVSTIVDSNHNQEYRRVINQASMVTPDGMPVVWLAKLKGNKVIQRTYGPDLMLAVCNEGQDKGYRHYFYGGTDDTCVTLKNVLKDKFPNINIAGMYSPPFRPAHSQESEEIIQQINQSKADILWVGLGSPKQDYWMSEHRQRLNIPVIIGVGAAFDFISGVKKQAPKWMQRNGLEWLFRFCCEPRRLWRRYLIGNSQFIYFVIRDLCRFRSGLRTKESGIIPKRPE